MSSLTLVVRLLEGEFMAQQTEIKTRVTPHFTLILDSEDGSAAKTWKLCATYKAIAKIEDATRLDLKKVADWPKISSGRDFPKIVHGLLEKFNPEVTLDEVLEVLNPEAQRLLSDEIFSLMFPGVVDALKKQQDAGATADPNPQTASPTV
jgi:hypothetical protein